MKNVKLLFCLFLTTLVSCVNNHNEIATNPNSYYKTNYPNDTTDIFRIIEMHRPVEFLNSSHPYTKIINWGKLMMNDIESIYGASDIDYTTLDEENFSLAINELCSQRYDNYDDGYDFDSYYHLALEEILSLINTHPSIRNVINYGVNLRNSVNYEIDLDTNTYSFEIIIGDMIYNKMEILYCYENNQNIIVDENLIDDNTVVASNIRLENEPMSRSLSAKNLKWPHNTIKYRFANNVRQDLKRSIITATEDWTNATGLVFEEIKNSSWNQFVWALNFNPHLKISQGNSNISAGSSTVGYRAWSSMIISEFSVSTCTHEFGHTIGLYHEMQRPDRNEYLYIDFSNIKLGYRHNFVKKWNWFVDYSTEMDFNSLMMYSPNAFSIDGYDVIYRVDGGSIEPSNEITDIDAQHVIEIYN